MQSNIFKKRRTKAGRKVIGRLYRGRYRLEWMLKSQEVALKTPDKQVAEQYLVQRGGSKW